MNNPSPAEIDPAELNSALRAVAAYCLVYPIIGGAAMDLRAPRSMRLLEALTTRACAAIEDYDALARLS